MTYNLPVIILNGTLLLPCNEMKLEFDDEVSKNIIEEAEMFHDKKILIVTKLSMDELLDINSLPHIGTVARIKTKLELPNGKVRVTLRGEKRAGVVDYLNTADSIESLIYYPKIQEIDKPTNEAIIRKLNNDIELYIDKLPYMSNSLLSQISEIDDLDKLTDIIVSNLPIDNNKKLLYLSEFNPVKRVEMLLEDIYKEQQLFDIEEKIDNKVQKELDQGEKSFYLKEKIKQLQNEIGEILPKDEEVINLRDKVNELDCDKNIKNKILHEINRYYSMSDVSPEISMVRNYIDLLVNIPWNINTEDEEDLSLVRKKLDESHYGLEEAKLRVIEYLAIKKASSDINAPILCLVGPPGVGKTTLAYSIATSMNRNFTKISVGGVDDEAYIKGHIRTYIGSTPGKIIDGIKRAKSSNPVFLIDEIDKMSGTYKGDPRSALLEVLDSNQNKHFKDNYLEEEFDLSKVFFITTANDIDKIPLELKDRLEIIKVPGYTDIEKLEIVKQRMIPTICKEHSIKNIKISDEDILNIIRYYTKESGLRELERCISKIVRKIVTDKVLNNKKGVVAVKDIEKYLGKRKYEKLKITSEVGISNALAYTVSGGEVLQIEANHFKGNGELILTGSMGEVMSESAKVALSYVKANAKLFGIDTKLFNDDIHINIPDITTKKEGASAGVSITTSIISALSNLTIKNNIAFTGELTLRGNILRVDGIKEKAIGAYINNIDTIFIPKDNLKDIEELKDCIKDRIKFIPVDKYEDIYNYLKEE